MKRLNLLVLTLFLVLGQWSSFEHAFHEHQESEVCDFCLNKKPLEQLANHTIDTFIPQSISQQHEKLAFELVLNTQASYFSARAPPRLI